MPTLTKSQLIDLLTNLPPETRIQVDQPPGSSLSVDILTEEKTVTQTKADILQAEYADLIGKEITVSDAAKKYNIPRQTILNWKNSNYITVLETGYRLILDEADVAYCADIYHDRKESGIGFYGSPLLDEDGLPYKLKHPSLAKYRRRKKEDEE